MDAKGSVIARVYTSEAYLPLPNAPVTFSRSDPDGTKQLIALRFTDSSGITEPIYLDTPDLSESLSPGNSQFPYTTVDIQASYPGYRSITFLGVQVFPGVETIQGIQLLPVSEPDNPITVPGSTQNLR